MGAWSGSTDSGPCLSQALTVRCPSSCFLSIASIFTSLYELRPHYLLETCSKPKRTYFLPNWLVCWNMLKTTFDGKHMLKSSVFHVITSQHFFMFFSQFLLAPAMIWLQAISQTTVRTTAPVRRFSLPALGTLWGSASDGNMGVSVYI